MCEVLAQPLQRRFEFALGGLFGFEARHIIPMHLPPGEEPWMKNFGGFDGIMKTVHGALPGTLRLASEMECADF